MKPIFKLTATLLLAQLTGCATTLGLTPADVSAVQYAAVVQDLAEQAARDVPAGYVPLRYRPARLYGAEVEQILRRKGYAILAKGKAEPVSVEVMREVNTIYGALKIGGYRVSRAYQVTSNGIAPKATVTRAGIDQ